MKHPTTVTDVGLSAVIWKNNLIKPTTFYSYGQKQNTNVERQIHSVCFCVQMRFMLLFSRQGKLRLQKWYTATAERDKKKMVRELMQIVLARKPKMCSFLEWKDLKIVYKR